jgi:hypothetical protein
MMHGQTQIKFILGSLVEVHKFVSWSVICEFMRVGCLDCGPVECDVTYVVTPSSGHDFLRYLLLREADFLLRN